LFLGVIKNIYVSTEAMTQPEAAPGIHIGPPTVTGNTGAGLNNKSLKAFVTADPSYAEWMRLPAPRERCQLSGLARTTLNEAIQRGDVRAITVRQPGATRGIKLINRASLVSWLAKLDSEQNSSKEVPYA
jgi:hypothetical protein